MSTKSMHAYHAWLNSTKFGCRLICRTCHPIMHRLTRYSKIYTWKCVNIFKTRRDVSEINICLTRISSLHYMSIDFLTMPIIGSKARIIGRPVTQNSSSVSACNSPDSKVHEANMAPTWVLSAPDGPHVGPMNLAMREGIASQKWLCHSYLIVTFIQRTHKRYPLARELCVTFVKRWCWWPLCVNVHLHQRHTYFIPSHSAIGCSMMRPCHCRAYFFSSELKIRLTWCII